MVIFLVGFMGAGKTSIAQLVAQQYGYTYIDTDHVIEQQTQKSISSLFEELGEDGFRQLEAETLRQLTLLPNTIVATGGGLPCFNNNMQWMNQHGTTIYIQQTVNELVSRLSTQQHNRPLLKDLTNAALASHIEDLLHKREPYYKQAKFAILGTLVSAETIINTAIL